MTVIALFVYWLCVYGLNLLVYAFFITLGIALWHAYQRWEAKR